MPYFFNKFYINKKNNQNRIICHSKLYIGTKYIITLNHNDSDNNTQCGILVNKRIDNYGLHIYFKVGNAIYLFNEDLKEAIFEYHIQSYNLLNIKECIYNYPLCQKIQQDIKLFYYIKYIKHMHLPDDIKNILLKYF